MQCIDSRKHIYLLNFFDRYGSDFFQSDQVSTSLEDVKQMVVSLHRKMTTECIPEDGMTNQDNPNDPGTTPAIRNENDPHEDEDPDKDFDAWAHKLFRSQSPWKWPSTTRRRSLISGQVQLPRYGG